MYTQTIEINKSLFSFPKEKGKKRKQINGKGIAEPEGNGLSPEG